MERKVNKIKLFVKNNTKSMEAAQLLKSKLKEQNFQITEENYDLAISIGGDGSFLKMVNENQFNRSILYVGINTGTLGFLQEIDLEKCPDFIQRLNESDFKIEEISIAEGSIITSNETISFQFLNEIVIRDKNLKVLEAAVNIDTELLEDFTGDGLLISTSTGSTAYNICYGGSIIYNTLATLSITPIAPINSRAYHNLINSVIIPDKKIITIAPTKNKELLLTIDGINHSIKDILKIQITINNHKIKCLRMNESNFIKTVHNKLLKSESYQNDKDTFI